MIDNQCQKPTYESREIPSGLNEIWTTGRYSDITLITDTKKFKAHKVILAANSPVFDTIFNNHMKDRSSDEVYLKNIKESVVKTFLDFLYTGKIEENGDQNLGELFSIASKFKVAKLTSIVEKLITINLNDENALEFLKLGCLFNCDKMKVSTFNVLKSMFDFPLKEDLMNQPEAIEKLIEAKQNFDSSLK
ncbi:CLUMA_CG018061, isoform A [Clunio marinus]|uniref:CLUMA_CG018061, isoform A n=1 Tax=Clunio marinus TaxID=568069 RepID=A0A1J1J3V6_9DIPT|nr:CLUMA_CG018061, isoform A [Clunio marinus]